MDTNEMRSLPLKPGSGYKDGIYYSKRPDMSIPTDWRLDFTTFLFDQSNLDLVALVDASTGESVTYRELKRRVFSVASGLADVGVKQGDVVMILSPNSIHYIVSMLAICSIGAVTTAMNPASTTFELEFQVKNSQSTFIITIPDLLGKVAGFGVQLIVIDDWVKYPNSQRQFGRPGVARLSDLYKADPDLAPRVRIRQSDTALLLFSSGTTGLSKGVKLSHGNCIAAISIANLDVAESDMHEQWTSAAVLPFYHIFGLVTQLSNNLRKGSMVVILEKFEMKMFLATIERYKIKSISIVPPILIALVKTPLVANYDLSSLRVIGVGGAPIGKDAISACRERFKGIFIRQGYGMTETGGACTTAVPGSDDSLHDSSVGLLMPNIQAKIVDAESGDALPPSQSGEIWVRGPVVMQGYFLNDNATAETLDKEQWLRTGDLGYFDENGYLHIVDRIKELIKHNGYQVAPAELEAILNSHSQILSSGVVGFPDEKAGEIPVAFVVKAPNSTLSEQDVLVFVAEKVSHYKKLRKVIFVDSVPISPSGKLLRRQLKSMRIPGLPISRL